MCLAIPSRVLEINDQMALVDTAGEQRKVSLLLMHEEVAVGDYVLIQHGQFAYERVDAERARESLALMEEVFAQGQADVRAW
ncbi:MAG: HypC/HybG/HupF family hydrogenase formation chaperone [Betaproteobacteria bacterium]|nr:HypC/HybG/HupF family hydrogenase formation chaperone [Betaproteobacteria bacterium]